ncbi:hypothetical protein GDO86_002032 [Hymenochirus boettgeri]|uniref:Diablo homolog, mitochondrial n=1 Tax=Hymenochirus boettgeri TaxID=247094 RepID=A0A8T2KL55_9PIPI|nr:hypothetical protein GDO86_002032 [Hymenochirus boettgeri]
MASRCKRLFWGVSSLFRQSLQVTSKRGFLLRSGSWAKYLSLGVGASLCAIPVGQRSEPILSNDSLIKRAATLLTDSSSTFLSQTTYALVESLTEYTLAVYTLISLQNKYTSLLDKMNSSEENAIWQVIIGARVKVNQLKEQYLKYESSWQRAVSLSEMAAEAAYQAGADQASVTVRNHIQLAHLQVQEAREQAQKAEVQLTATQAEEIKKTITEDKGNPPSGGSPRNSLSEEEIPEAYLRED